MVIVMEVEKEKEKATGWGMPIPCKCNSEYILYMFLDPLFDKGRSPAHGCACTAFAPHRAKPRSPPKRVRQKTVHQQ